MMIARQPNKPNRAEPPAPLDSMPSSARSASRRRSTVVGLLAAFGIAALSAAGTRAAVQPRLEALETDAAAARAEIRDARSDVSQLQTELEQLRVVHEYSSAFRIPADLAEAIREAAQREDLDPDIAFRLVATESSFRRRAISPVGAVGYTQVMPSTANWLEPGLAEGDLFDRDTNLRLGFRYLRMLLDQYGDARLALLAYNRGPGVVSGIMARGEDPANGYARQILGSE
ncbi:MAG: transglycosylase SLT domain-containing protein [Gemmatimonadota bacterium]|nr:transglycosylase SLT domain-containing protein [Gemmatimonadota bacterium]MDH3427026.1 transglycosylase SLT domain-containing protein [Gemmatimonadota bacterium]